MLKYIISLLIFGSNGVVSSYIDLTSHEIVLLRSLLGSLLLIAIFFISGQRLTVTEHKKDLIYIAISGIALAVDWLLLFEAYTQIGVGLSTIISYCGPVIVVALSPVLFREAVTWIKGVALITAFFGVLLVGGQAVLNGVDSLGLICAGLSAFAYAAMVISNKMSKQVAGIEKAMIQMFFVFITVFVFVGCKQGMHMEIAFDDWLPILILGLLNTGVGCYLYFSSIGNLPVQTVAICGYLEPLSAVVFSALALGEIMTPIQILGAVFIIGGAALGELIKKAPDL